MTEAELQQIQLLTEIKTKFLLQSNISLIVMQPQNLLQNKKPLMMLLLLKLLLLKSF